MTAVGGAISLLLLVDGGFFVLQVAGLTCGQLSALYALADAILLIFRALANLLRAVVLGGGVMLVLINLLRKALLLLLQGSAVGRGQMTVVLGLHRIFFLVDL